MNPRFDINICKLNLALFFRSMFLLLPIMLFFYQENGLTVADFFLFQGIFYLSSILSEMPVGYLSNNISRKNLLIISFFIFIGFYTAYLLFRGYYVILIGEILFGISKVMMDNAMSGYLYDYLNHKQEKEKMVKYWGYVNFYLSLGTALGGLLGTFLYSKLGFNFVISFQILLVCFSILLVIGLPGIKCTDCETEKLSEKINKFFITAKEIYNNKAIKYHIFYSGLLTSFSILFALSFQPIMQSALFPVFLFGVVICTNHSVRALSGVIAGKWLRTFNIDKIVLPLYSLYIVAFLCIFIINSVKLNTFILLIILVFICLIIGVQVVFSILHVSRIHRFVTIDKRGTLMAINNFVARVTTAIILISSKLFIDTLGIKFSFIIAFVCFLVACSYFMVQIVKIRGRE